MQVSCMQVRGLYSNLTELAINELHSFLAFIRR